MLSNNAKNPEITIKRKIRGAINIVTCPVVFSKYNKKVGGVDTAD